MSLGLTLKTASSGLQAAQANLRVTSDNIANVNTPGYVRKAVIQQPLVVDGVGQGVKVEGIKRITDQYLQLASLTAGADAAKWAAVSQYLDNAQSLFGDPSTQSFFFNRLDRIYGAFAAAADDPSSSLLRSQGLSSIEDFLAEAGRINSQIVQLGSVMETRIAADIARANDLLDQINGLNTDISRARLVGGDSSGSENIQSQLLDELSTLMSVRVSPRANGGITVRSLEGVMLAGDGAAVLSYNSTATTPGYLSAIAPGAAAAQPISIDNGEIRGLMDLRDVELPKLYEQLGEFTARATQQLNAAHNASAAYPAPSSLTGRNTGLDLPTAAAGFSGTATIAVVNTAGGALQRTVAIDFTAGTMSVDGGAGVAFTPATFLATLNASLGAQGSASFANGALTISGAAGRGIAIDEGTSAKAGRGFSHFFGLNDTGLRGVDSHGFTPGGQISFRLSYPDGRPIRDIAVAMPAAATMNDLVNALNNNATGVGLYGAFTLDANGALAFQGSPPTDAKLSVVTDNTQRGAGGPSLSALFGLGVRERSARAGRFLVDQALESDPQRVALGRLDTSVAIGQIAVRPGDGRGGQAISESGDVPILFQAAGYLGKVTMTVSRYAAEFGGGVGRAAQAAETRMEGAKSVATEATQRRQAIEGVNLDEELVNLTTYQQAFNASARMIQAASELLDVLMNMV
jgi:flagellar hook-associated protein 1